MESNAANVNICEYAFAVCISANLLKCLFLYSLPPFPSFSHLFTGFLSLCMQQKKKANILIGQWENELKSVMTITYAAGGLISGTYQTAVASGTPPPPVPLSGRYNQVSTTLGWAVSYDPNYSTTTAWSGQIQFNPSTRMYNLHSTWVLTSPTTPKENWLSTNVGFNTFVKK